MSQKVLVCVTVLAIVGIALLTPALHAAKADVMVDAKCPKNDGGKFSITVKPFTVDIKSKDSVSWKIKTDNKTDVDIRVTAKDPDVWLFKKESIKGKKDVVLSEWNPDAEDKKKTYAYNITVYCGANDDEPIVLDPRIRVGGG